MRERNLNLLKNQHINDNPFSKLNPYRLKAKFYSQKKYIPQNTKLQNKSSNPQSLKYKRNYKQNPATFEYRQLKDNFIQVKNNSLIKKRCNQIQQQLEQQDYRLRLRKFVADKFCPSDPYLEIVKDKFTYLSNNPASQFQNVMKMSNLGISRFTVKNSDSYSKVGGSLSKYNNKQNPFYRKNLISSSTQRINLPYESSFYSSNKVQYPYNSDSSYVSAYQYNDGICNSVYSSSYQHQQQSALNPKEINVHSLHLNESNHRRKDSNVSDYILGRVNTELESKKDDARQTPKSMNTSFGPDHNWKDKKGIFTYVDTVIQRSLQDPLNIQSKAEKTIKIKGKTFYFNQVNRINNC